MAGGLLLVAAAIWGQANAMNASAAFVNGAIFALGLDIFFAGLIACFVKPFA